MVSVRLALTKYRCEFENLNCIFANAVFPLLQLCYIADGTAVFSRCTGESGRRNFPPEILT